MSSTETNSWHLCDYKWCRKTFSSKYQLNKHKKEHTSSALRKTKRFSSNKALAHTLPRVSSPSPEIKNEPEIITDKDTKKVKSKSGKPAVKESETVEDDPDFRAVCAICFQAFKKRRHLRGHLVSAHASWEEPDDDHDCNCTCKHCLKKDKTKSDTEQSEEDSD